MKIPTPKTVKNYPIRVFGEIWKITSVVSDSISNQSQLCIDPIMFCVCFFTIHYTTPYTDSTTWNGKKEKMKKMAKWDEEVLKNNV